MTGIPDEEIAAFNAVARRMLANLRLLEAAGGDEEQE